eukprot:CAMPEP_0116131062 /NCGR_PEP_ID=MMETSP0329-20121206/8808_1 /TAXON_ID=697910 /ORGANISM="Pseudo-nitzschia arenysensis, Strain B593" /LENGTH=127 /DNA_ID=CAMNT_0003625473 /DNA_START=72 /DNA_END=455 /DNA_ORIENTATION=-
MVNTTTIATTNTTTTSTFDDFLTETPIVTMPPTPTPSIQTGPSRNAAKNSGSTAAVVIAVGVVLMLSIQRARRRNQQRCGNQHRCERNTKNNNDLHVPNGSTDASVGGDTGGVSSGGEYVGDGGGEM